MGVTVRWEKKGFLPTTTLGLLHASCVPHPGLRLSRATLLLHEGSPFLNSPGTHSGTGCFLPRPGYPSYSAWVVTSRTDPSANATRRAEPACGAVERTG